MVTEIERITRNVSCSISVDIVGNLVVIVIAVGGLQSVDEDVSPEAVGVGLCLGIADQYVRDHEPLASVLDNFGWRLAFSGLEQLLIRLVGRTYSSQALFSGAVGGGIGTLLYRLVYGVVYDVPRLVSGGNGHCQSVTDR